MNGEYPLNTMQYVVGLVYNNILRSISQEGNMKLTKETLKKLTPATDQELAQANGASGAVAPGGGYSTGC